MLQYRIVFTNTAGVKCLAITCADDEWFALQQVMNSISDYGRTVRVDAQPLETVTHIRVRVLPGDSDVPE